MSKELLWQPNQEWRPYDAEYENDEPIERAVERINQRPYGELIDELRSRISYFKPNKRYEKGIAFAVFDGDNPNEYSTTEALVVFNPYANGTTDNMLIRSEFIRLCAEEAEVRDEDGKLLPVCMVASPSVSSELIVPRSKEDDLKEEGRFEYAASELLKPIRRRNYGRIALAGFSQGADLAASAAEVAYNNSLDAKSVALGDPAGVRERSIARLLFDFARTAPSLKPNIKHGGVEPAIIAQGMSKETKPEQNEMLMFARSALMKPNRLLWQGLARDDFIGKVGDLLEEDSLDRIVVAWGGNSTISPAEVMRSEFEKMKRHGKTTPALTTIEVAGAQHGWGDNLPLLGRLYLEQFKA